MEEASGLTVGASQDDLTDWLQEVVREFNRGDGI